MIETEYTSIDIPNAYKSDTQQTLEQHLEANRRKQLAMVAEMEKKAEALEKVKNEIEALKKTGRQ